VSEGELYVTYAKQDEDKEDDVAGKGNGFIDVFDTDGNFLQRVDSQSKLNSPWGLAFAPTDFGRFSAAGVPLSVERHATKILSKRRLRKSGPARSSSSSRLKTYNQSLPYRRQGGFNPRQLRRMPGI